MTKGLKNRYIKTDAAKEAYAIEAAVSRLALSLADLVEASGVSQKDLARRLGVSEARVSQVLAADANPTVKTLVRLAHAVNHKMSFSFSSYEQSSKFRPLRCVWSERAQKSGLRSDRQTSINVAA